MIVVVYSSVQYQSKPNNFLLLAWKIEWRYYSEY